MITDSFISEVEIAKILIFSSANALNILNVTPGVATIPAPTIEIFATDPGVKNDIPAWCRVHGHSVLSVEEQDEKIVLLIEKN